MDSVSPSDMLYMEAKSIFVQLIRSIPGLADKRPYNLAAIAERAATTKDATLVRKGIKVKEMLRELEEQNIVDRADGYKLMQDEVAAELVHLGNLREKVLLETKSLEAVYKTICDHNNYLRGQLEQYKAYLQNVRLTASKEKGQSTGVGVVTVGGKEKKPSKPVVHGPYRFTHAQLEKEGIIVESNVPDNRYVVDLPCPGVDVDSSLCAGGQTFTSTSPRHHLARSSSRSTTRVARRRSWRWTSTSMISSRRLVSPQLSLNITSECLTPFTYSKKTTSTYWILNTYSSTSRKCSVSSTRSSRSDEQTMPAAVSRLA